MEILLGNLLCTHPIPSVRTKSTNEMNSNSFQIPSSIVTWKSALKTIVRSLLVHFAMIVDCQCVRSREIYSARNIAAEYRCCCKNVRLAVSETDMRILATSIKMWKCKNYAKFTKFTVSCSCVSRSDIVRLLIVRRFQIFISEFRLKLNVYAENVYRKTKIQDSKIVYMIYFCDASDIWQQMSVRNWCKRCQLKIVDF